MNSFIRTAATLLFLAPLSLSLSCTSTEVAVLATDSPLLNFGELPVGQSASGSLVLRNDGLASVVLSDPTLSEDDSASFTLVTALSGTELRGGHTISVEVEFTPSTEGVHEALLTFSGSQPSLSGGGGGEGDLAVFPAQVSLLGSTLSGDDDDSAAGDDDDTSGDDDDSVAEDLDGDGYDAETSGGQDCDDTNSTIFPGAAEICDGVDNDCDDEIDEDLSLSWYADFDGDGYGNGADSVDGCSRPLGYVSNDGDCDDTNAAISPAALELCDGIDNDCDATSDEEPVDGSTWHLDSDSDGFGGQLLTEVACSAPTGYVDNDQDCDDLDPLTAPNIVETCDGEDQDCDGQVDEEASNATTWYLDADQDNHGGTFLTQVACTQPSGYVATDGDCNDLSPLSYPGAAELCDGADNDCNTLIDDGVGVSWFEDVDGDGFGVATSTQVSCTAPSGYSDSDGDCNDGDPAVHPGAPELCDGVDRNCDGTAGTTTWYLDTDGDGYGDAGSTVTACASPQGYSSNSTDCDDAVPSTNPGSFEVCDGVDNNCDTLVDDGSALNSVTWFEDADGDSFGTSSSQVSACAQPSGFADNAGDCNDIVGAGETINPNASEICDGIDNDCDGAIDDSAIDATSWFPDSDSDDEGDELGTAVIACSPPSGHIDNQDDCDDTSPAIHSGAAETCDGIDNNCDTIIDTSGGIDLCLYGDGRDGDVALSSDQEIQNSVLGSNRSTNPDATQTVVNSAPLASSTSLSVVSSAGFAAGDLAILINMQGSAGDIDDVGNWELVSVAAAPTPTSIVLSSPPGQSYSGNTFSNQTVLLQRVPQWNDVTVSSNMRGQAWDGTSGGILAFVATGTVTVSGAITMTERGYRGGTGLIGTGFAHPGEGRAGTSSADSSAANDNGGGGSRGEGSYCNGNSGGGAHATRDSDTAGAQCNGATGGIAGNVVGNAALSEIYLGGAAGGCQAHTGTAQDGSDGGGIVFIRASTLSVSGQIHSRGGDGGLCPGGDASNRSGGAGGSVYLVAEQMVLTAGAVDATGGSRHCNSNNGCGHFGGEGRVRLEYTTLNGNTFPDPAEETSTCEPDPGSSSTPGD